MKTELFKVKKDLSYISFARALAIFLVVNSHATGLYPSAVANIIGRGGAIGNALFFFVSGFALYLSLVRKGDMSFKSWLPHRLLRIWPSIWICYGVFILTGFWGTIKWTEFFLPIEANWFLGAILVFYPIFFVCVRYFDRYLLPVIVGLFAFFVLAFGAIGTDAQSWVVGVGSPWKLHWIYYFGIMLLGAFLAKREFFERAYFSTCSWKKAVLWCGAFGTSVCCYYVMRGGFEVLGWWKLQFLAPFALPLVCISGITFCKSVTVFVPRMFAGTSYKGISFVSNHTLEIYLVHGVALSFCKTIVFPLNLLCALSESLLLAAILKCLSEKLRASIYWGSDYLKKKLDATKGVSG